MLTSFRITSLTIDRFTSGSGSYNTSGEWTGEASASFSIKCSLQPTSRNDLQSLPEERRNRKSFTVFTDVALQMVVTGATGTNPDQTTIDGEKYECVNVEPWRNNVLNHYKAIFQLL